jgi:hypothetical protein
MRFKVITLSAGVGRSYPVGNGGPTLRAGVPSKVSLCLDICGTAISPISEGAFYARANG